MYEAEGGVLAWCWILTIAGGAVLFLGALIGMCVYCLRRSGTGSAPPTHSLVRGGVHAAQIPSDTELDNSVSVPKASPADWYSAEEADAEHAREQDGLARCERGAAEQRDAGQRAQEQYIAASVRLSAMQPSVQNSASNRSSSTRFGRSVIVVPLLIDI